jgi:hypothetical protein
VPSDVAVENRPTLTDHPLASARLPRSARSAVRPFAPRRPSQAVQLGECRIEGGRRPVAIEVDVVGDCEHRSDGASEGGRSTRRWPSRLEEACAGRPDDRPEADEDGDERATDQCDAPDVTAHIAVFLRGADRDRSGADPWFASGRPRAGAQAVAGKAPRDAHRLYVAGLAWSQSMGSDHRLGDRRCAHVVPLGLPVGLRDQAIKRARAGPERLARFLRTSRAEHGALGHQTAHQTAPNRSPVGHDMAVDEPGRCHSTGRIPV